jgi:hypothetical protein
MRNFVFFNRIKYKKGRKKCAPPQKIHFLKYTYPDIYAESPL